MANRVYRVEEVELIGWNDEKGNSKPIRMYPLVIKKMRIVSEILDQKELKQKPEEEWTEEEKEKSFLDVLLEAAAYSMRTYEPELSDPDVLADYVDYETLAFILEIAIGLKLNDPNLLAAVTATAGTS